jgi:hypothetical protein
MSQKPRCVPRSSLRVVAGLTCLVLGACAQTAVPDEPISVDHGRLKFSDTQTLFDTLAELNALPEDRPPSSSASPGSGRWVTRSAISRP